MSPILIFIIYLALSFFVGVIGKPYRFGFFGYFLASLIFTPIGGLLLLVPSEKSLNSSDSNTKK